MKIIRFTAKILFMNLTQKKKVSCHLKLKYCGIVCIFEIVKFYLIHDQFQMVMRLCFNFYHFELLPMLYLVYTLYTKS